MRDIYLYEGTDVLRNLLDIRDRKLLEEAEADYVTFRLSSIYLLLISHLSYKYLQIPPHYLIAFHQLCIF